MQLQIKVSYGPQNKTQKCRQKTRSLARRDDCLHGTHKPPEQKAISCLHPINFHVDVVKKSRFREREKKILHEVMAESSFFFGENGIYDSIPRSGESPACRNQMWPWWCDPVISVHQTMDAEIHTRKTNLPRRPLLRLVSAGSFLAKSTSHGSGWIQQIASWPKDYANVAQRNAWPSENRIICFSSIRKKNFLACFSS